MTREELEQEDDFTIGGEDDVVESPIVDDDGMFDLDFGDEPEVEVVHEEATPSEVVNTPTEEEINTEESTEGDALDTQVDTEIEEGTEPEGSEPVFTDIVTHFADKGILLPDPEKEYEDSESGFEEVLLDTLRQRDEERLSKLSPEARRLLEIEERGGDIREAFTEMYEFDFKDLDLSDETVQEEIVRDHLASQGYSDEPGEDGISELDDMLETLKDTGRIGRAAEKAKSYFVNQQEAEREEYVQSLEAKKAEERQKQDEAINQVQYQIDTMESIGVFGNVPKAERDAFKAYLFEVGEDGKTQAQRDNSLEAIIVNEFNKFKKFDYSLIENRAKTKTTIDWRKKAARITDKTQEAKGASQRRAERPDNPSVFSLGDI